MIFKSGVVKEDIFNLTPKMLFIFGYVVWLFQDVLNKSCVITSLSSDRAYRDNDVHLYGRGVDFRVHHLNKDERNFILKAINSRFNYGNGHETAKIHGPVDHLHCQAPYDTSVPFFDV